MTDTFAEAIELTKADESTWHASIPDGWDFMGIANGGLVSSVMVTALAAATERPDPITSTAHFLRPAFPGPASIDVSVIRTGRTLTTARAQLTQNDRLVAHLVASLGDLEASPEGSIIDTPMPDLPPPEECMAPDADPNFQAPAIAHRLNLHLNPAHTQFARGESGDPVMSGWAYVPYDGSSTMMPVIADAMPPPFFNTGKYFGPIPTIELTVHTHGRPGNGPVAALFKTDHAGARYLEEDGWVWNAEGELIGVSRQIAVLPN